MADLIFRVYARLRTRRGGFQTWVYKIALDHTCRRARRSLSEAEWARFLGADVPYAPACAGLTAPPG